MTKNQIFKFHFSYSHNTPDNNLWINNITVWEIRHKMVFLILFPSFMPKNDAFLISFKSFFLLFSYSFYLFCSFLMHDGCSFFRTIAGLAIIPFLMSFINQLPIVYCFPVYHSPYILLFSLTHCYFFLLLSVSLHSSEQIVPL